MLSEATALTVKFGNLDCYKVNIGSHRSCNLLNIETFVNVFFNLIIGEHQLMPQGVFLKNKKQTKYSLKSCDMDLFI